MPTKCQTERQVGGVSLRVSQEILRSEHFKYSGKPLKHVKREEGCDLTRVFVRFLDTLLRMENKNGSKEPR